MKKNINLLYLQRSFASIIFVLTTIIIVPAAKAATNLSIPLFITDGSAISQTLYFGLNDSASEGLDTSLGESTYPPMPPEGIFNTRFNLPTGNDDSLTDYRRLDGTNHKKTYTLQYQTSEEKHSITINWSLPANVTGELQDVLTGQIINVPMENQGSYTVLDPVKYNKLAITIDYSALPISNIQPTGTITPIITPTISTIISSSTVTPSITPTATLLMTPTSANTISITPSTIHTPSTIPSVTTINTTNLSTSDAILPSPITNITGFDNSALGITTMTADKATSPKIIEQSKTAISGLVSNSQINTTQFISLNTQTLTTLASKYWQVYSKTPNTNNDWTDAALIVSGQAPQTKITANEEIAKKIFKQVYKTSADLNNYQDQKLINSLAYSLEPNKRNIALEQKGLKLYVKTYKRLPKSTTDWNIVKAVSYSDKK